jgi:PAS domain S-box-containing protein
MVNEAAIKHYGFSEEEFLGMNIMDLRPREHRLKMGMPIKSASTDKKQALYSGEQIHCKKNGEIIDAEVVTHDIAIDGYEAVLVVVNDVTARNKARKQLKESEKMLRTISENFPNGAVAILDKELRYQYTAGKEFHIPGASHDYFYQTEYTSHFPKNVRQDVHENLMKVFKGESVVFEASYSGQSYMISAVPLVGVDKTINKIVLASQNISRQKEALKRVHFQSNILERLSNFVIVADNNFNITYFNKGAEDLFGERIRQLYSQRVTHLFLDAYNEIAEEALKEAMENKTIDTELKCINASKKEIWINGRFSKMFDEENNPIGILCLGKDISTDKKNAAEKEMLIEELTQNNSDLRQFSYITSHNLRSPLSNLLGIIRLIDTSSITDPMNLLLLDNFKNSTIQLNDTVNDLINVLIIKNKVNAKKEELNIMKSLERVINSIQTTIDESGLEIQADFSEANEIEFNHSYLESILLNLLTNAIKYKSPGKKPLIKISTKPVEEGVKLYFCDNGLGIDLERYGDRIFGLYQRFHDHADSKGLGLYIVNSQVRAMGGSIEVESEVDKGTTFIITFKKSNIDD